MALTNRVAIVTGGGSGIGRECALYLAQAGANVVVPDLNLAAAQATADLIKKNGGEALAIQMDVTQKSQIHATVEQVLKVYGTSISW